MHGRDHELSSLKAVLLLYGPRDGSGMSYLEYYKKAYDKDSADPGQPFIAYIVDCSSSGQVSMKVVE